MNPLERFKNIETVNEITTAIFLTKDITEANLLRRSILSEIETYAIDIVIFYINTSSRHDEIIALRLGQLVIDHEKYEHNETPIRINVKGPKEFSTKDIKLPFKYETPIMVLREGETIICDVIVKKGQGKQHVKWRPVSTVSIKEVDEGFKFTIKGIGMMSGDKILLKGLEKIKEASKSPAINLFSKPMVPPYF